MGESPKISTKPTSTHATQRLERTGEQPGCFQASGGGRRPFKRGSLGGFRQRYAASGFTRSFFRFRSACQRSY